MDFNNLTSALVNELRSFSVDLQNLLFPDTKKTEKPSNTDKKMPGKTAFYNKPLSTPLLNIAILSDGTGYSVPKAIKMIEKATKSTVKPINYHAPAEIDLHALAIEVTTCLKMLEEKKLLGSNISRVAAFIDLVKSGVFEAPISLKIINDTQILASKLDCIFLPGSNDHIPPSWYEKDSQGIKENFYRSLIEFTFLQEAKNKGIPLMGVCRGFQAAYIFNGKKLKTKIPDQYSKVQTFLPLKNDHNGLLNHIFKEGIQGLVMHYQGVTIEEGTNEESDLEPLTTACGLIKAAESKHGGASPLILTQFHPEFYEPGEELSSNPDRLSANNAKFIDIFYEGAKVRNFKRLNITVEALNEKRKQLRKPCFRANEGG